MNTVARFFIGVDLHQKVLQFCVVDRQGKMVREKSVRIACQPYAEQVFEEFARWRGRCRVAVESVGMNRWFVNGLLARGYDVVVADPTKLNLRTLGKKTDKRDAREIARRLWLGDIDRDAKTYYSTDHVYGDRKLERTRHDLVELRQSVGNQIRIMVEQLYGVGPMSALTIAGELGDVHRFRNADAVAPAMRVWCREYETRGTRSTTAG